MRHPTIYIFAALTILSSCKSSQFSIQYTSPDLCQTIKNFTYQITTDSQINKELNKFIRITNKPKFFIDTLVTKGFPWFFFNEDLSKDLSAKNNISIDSAYILLNYKYSKTLDERIKYTIGCIQPNEMMKNCDVKISLFYYPDEKWLISIAEGILKEPGYSAGICYYAKIRADNKVEIIKKTNYIE